MVSATKVRLSVLLTWTYSGPPLLTQLSLMTMVAMIMTVTVKMMKVTMRMMVRLYYNVKRMVKFAMT